MLKKLLEEAAYNELDDAKKGLYTKGADGKYHLQVEDDDGEELKRAKEHEKAKRKEAEERLAALENEKKAAEDKAREESEKSARAAGDIAALEKSWKEKLEQAVSAEKTRTSLAENALRGHLVDKAAEDLANEISTVPSLLRDVIKQRLKVEITEDGTAITRVLDAAGKPSAANLNDLRQELVDNKDYAAIIKASNASGGGATGGNGNGGGVPGQKKLSEMTATEEAAFANANPAEYQRMLNQA